MRSRTLSEQTNVLIKNAAISISSEHSDEKSNSIRSLIAFGISRCGSTPLTTNGINSVRSSVGPIYRHATKAPAY